MDTISSAAEDLCNLMQGQCINRLEVTAVPMSLQSTESGITATSAKLRQGSTMPNHKNSRGTAAQNHLQVIGALIHHSSTEELLSPAQKAAVPQSQAACTAESIRHQDYAAFFSSHSEYQKKKIKAIWAPHSGPYAVREDIN